MSELLTSPMLVSMGEAFCVFFAILILVGWKPNAKVSSPRAGIRMGEAYWLILTAFEFVNHTIPGALVSLAIFVAIDIVMGVRERRRSASPPGGLRPQR